MSKTSIINARIQPDLKKRVENILHKLGLSATEAITMFYSQIDLNDGLPFAVKIPSKRLKNSMLDIRNNKNITNAKDVTELKLKLGIKDNS
jgi:DNA-damage-inducible protein J